MHEVTTSLWVLVGMLSIWLLLQLALNYTAAPTVVTTNSSARYNTTNSSHATFAKQQLSRFVGECHALSVE